MDKLVSGGGSLQGGGGGTKDLSLKKWFVLEYDPGERVICTSERREQLEWWVWSFG